MKNAISSVLLGRNALPTQQHPFNLSNLIGHQDAKTAQEILGRHRLNPLNEECTHLEKPGRHRHFKLRAARGRDVRDHADQGAIRVPIRNADDQSRTNLLRNAEVHLPYLSRSGTRSLLLLIQCPERSGSQSREIVICQIIRHGNTLDDGASKLLTLFFRKLLELAKNLHDCLCHVLNIHRQKELSKC